MFPNQIKNCVVLAPMDGVTDAPFRDFLTDSAPYDYCVTEFFRISNSVPRPTRFKEHIPELKKSSRTPNGTPVQVQLLGGDANRMAESAFNAVSAGAIAIDINFGCPAPTVNRHDGGASLLKCPERMYKIVSAIRQAVPKNIPVSAKLRLGWDSIEPALENSHAASSAGADWLTLHARTKTQGYKSPVFWNKIGEVREQIQIPIIANGDLWAFEDFLKCREITGCDHFMLGRGALANPLLSSQIKNYFLKREGLEPAPLSFSWTRIFESYIHSNSNYVENINYSVRRIKQWIALSKPAGTLRWAEPLLRATDAAFFLAECLKLEQSISKNQLLPFKESEV